MIFEPDIVFPCDCAGEGVTVTPLKDTEDISEGEILMEEDKELRDFEESPFIQLSFWEYGHKTKGRWSWWWRLKIAWHVFRTGKPWADMVIMKAAVAKRLAHHVLYVIRKAEEEKNSRDRMIVQD